MKDRYRLNYINPLDELKEYLRAQEITEETYQASHLYLELLKCDFPHTTTDGYRKALVTKWIQTLPKLQC